MEKHQLTGQFSHETAYMRYDYQKEVLVIGGHMDCIDFIDRIVQDYLKKPLPPNMHSQRARVRYVINISKEKYRNFKNLVYEDFSEGLQKIQNLDRRL